MSGSRAGFGRLLLGAALLAGLVLAAYWPALHGGFVWDDDTFLTGNALIKAPDGLGRFWFSGAAPDYWPVTSTTLWLEWRLWGLNPLGYHATNLALHAAEVILLWAVLRKLRIPGAFLAAALFAVHPVNVESVAWITQRKNLMAMLFYLLSIYWFLRWFEGGRIIPHPPGNIANRGRSERRVRDNPPYPYWLSLLSFILAMLSKGSVAILPLVLLGVILCRRRFTPRDGVRLAPFFVVATALAAVDVIFAGRSPDAFVRSAGFVERSLGAATAVLFYLSKALWPAHLAFIYPRWSIDPGRWLWWLPLLAVIAVTMICWKVGRIIPNSPLPPSAFVRPPGGLGIIRPTLDLSRACLFAWGYFCASLIPVLGFTDVYFMRYSLVADHYQHLALIGVVTLAGAGWWKWNQRWSGATGPWRQVPRVAAAAVLAIFVGLTRAQCRTYRDLPTLYRATIAQNPACWLAYNNLGVWDKNHGDLPKAIELYQTALRLNPDYAEAHNNLGDAWSNLPGRLPDAIAEYQTALRLKPDYAEAYNNLGNAWSGLPGRLGDAIAAYRMALRLNPDYAEAHNNLGSAWSNLPGRTDDAIREYRTAVRLDPDNVTIQFNLAVALLGVPGQTQEAVAHLRAVLRLQPGNAEARQILAQLAASPP